MAAEENGLEQDLESCKGVFFTDSLQHFFLKRFMSDALEEHDRKASMGRTTITNLRFADDIDDLAAEEKELEAVVESLDKTCARKCREMLKR